MTSLCVVVGEDLEAVIDGRPVLIRRDSCAIHETDCNRGDDCRCPAALAAAGSLVCGWHADVTRDRLRELPDLWAILGARPSGTGTGGTGEPAQPISDHARDARTAMRVMLVTWCKILAEDRGSPLPDERVIARRTQLDVIRHQADYRVALQAWRNHRRETGPYEARARAHLMHQATTASAAAERAIESRETEADIIEALREHIDRHLAWLLNSVHADQLVHDVAGVWATARHIAHPAPAAAVRILCTCGRRVAVTTDKDAVMVCPGCGEHGTLTWWRRREAPPDENGPFTLVELPDWLLRHGVEVTHKQVRNWADRGIITRHNLVHTPARYDGETVLVIAHHRLGRRISA